MDETRLLRGRKLVIESREPPRHLPFTDVFDARYNLVEVLAALPISGRRRQASRQADLPASDVPRHPQPLRDGAQTTTAPRVAHSVMRDKIHYLGRQKWAIVIRAAKLKPADAGHLADWRLPYGIGL